MGHDTLNITIAKATNQDIDLLFSINQQLIIDEDYDRPLTDEKLNERWKQFFTEIYIDFFIKVENEIVGYSVIHNHQTPKYIRHFYVQKEYRRKGIGKKAFYLILNELDVKEIDVDVMYWNQSGLSFWKSLGFHERYIGLDLKTNL